MGVWIEIIALKRIHNAEQSLPLWECGLKCIYISENSVSFFVTPLVGVWIEITSSTILTNFPRSLPLWECGLKYQEVSVDVTPMVSLPLRECGLK